MNIKILSFRKTFFSPLGERKFMRNPIWFLSAKNQIGFRINFLSLLCSEEKIFRNDGFLLFGLRFFRLLIPAFCLLSCTAIHPPEPYLPQKSGVVPGEVITVNGNQNVYGVAQEHGVSMRDIIVLNGLSPPYALKPGQSLVLPFKRGEAGKGGAPVEGLAPAPLGGVQEAPLSPIEVQPLPPPLQPASQVSQSKNVLGKTVSSAPLESLNTPSAPPKQVATTMAPASPPPALSVPPAASSASAPAMVWPVQGPVLSAFGPKGQGVNNDGVNIGAPKGAPVVAAAPGTVVYAGNEMKGFGNLILIRHEGGWVTAYAYLDRMLVAKDAIVAQGDMIGTVGKTGNISSPQLHFETRHEGKVVDPDSVVKAP
jgi:murein DD-endopeptidase MepM/ murein hydrolase activator NlpD